MSWLLPICQRWRLGAIGRIATQLAGANVTIAGSTSKSGFGSLERMQERRGKHKPIRYFDERQRKILPTKANVRIPMYFGYGEIFVMPEYNPLDQDMPLATTLANQTYHAKKK